MNINHTNPYRSTRLPVFARNVVATSHPLAVQAGLRMMQQGGNDRRIHPARKAEDDFFLTNVGADLGNGFGNVVGHVP